MTFKDLKRRVTSSSNQQQTQSFDILQNKPFWNIEEHKQEDIRTKGECCFNHIIGLPTKDGLEKPIFDYQESLSVPSYSFVGISLSLSSSMLSISWEVISSSSNCSGCSLKKRGSNQRYWYAYSRNPELKKLKKVYIGEALLLLNAFQCYSWKEFSWMWIRIVIHVSTILREGTLLSKS